MGEGQTSRPVTVPVKTFEARDKIRPFLRGILTGTPLVEVAHAGLTHPGATVEQRGRYLKKLLKAGKPEHLELILKPDDESTGYAIVSAPAKLEESKSYRICDTSPSLDHIKIAAAKRIINCIRKIEIAHIILKPFSFEGSTPMLFTKLAVAGSVAIAATVAMLAITIGVNVVVATGMAALVLIGEHATFNRLNKLARQSHSIRDRIIELLKTEMPDEARSILSAAVPPQLPAHEKEPAKYTIDQNQ